MSIHFYEPNRNFEMLYPNPKRCLICQKNYRIYDTVIKQNIPLHCDNEVKKIEFILIYIFGQDIGEIIFSYLNPKNIIVTRFIHNRCSRRDNYNIKWRIISQKNMVPIHNYHGL